MLDAKDEQLTISKDLSLKLKSDLKRSRLQTKLVGTLGVVSAVAIIFILK